MGFPRLLLHSEQFCLFDMQEMYDFPATVSIILLNYFFGRNLEKFSPFLKIF